MRAGLLSDERVIATLNEHFVCTWTIIDDIERRVGKRYPKLAETLLGKHQYPFDFMFFSPQGEFITRLTSFVDLPGANPAVGHPHRSNEPQKNHTDVFLEALAKHFGPL